MARRFVILVVDDEPINVKTIHYALKADYEIITALNGKEAISKLKEQKPDLVLMDVMMPGIDGFDVCKIIKADSLLADIPVIFLTAMGSQDDELNGLKAGGIDYLTKPVNLVLLKQRVRNHLDLKEQHDLVKEQRDQLARQRVELEATLARVKHLEGIIPICMYCKNIRSNDASWHDIVEYITEHSDALFSHGVCPACMAKHCPECCT